MDKFLKELMDLITVEANNGDYYVDGYVPASALDELINKYYPEYEFSSDYTYSRWYPRTKSSKGTTVGDLLFKSYEQALIEALKKPLFLEGLIKNSPTGRTSKPGDHLTFKVNPFKKDG